MSPLALETFAEMTCDTNPYRFFGDRQFRLAISAQPLLSPLHRPLTRNNGHGAQIETPAAFIAKFLAYIKRRAYSAILAAASETDGFVSKTPGAGPNAAPA